MHEPGKGVEELDDIPFQGSHLRFVANHDGGDVNGQEAVAAQGRGQSVGEKAETQHHDGEERSVGNFDFFENPAGGKARSQADEGANGNLQQKQRGTMEDGSAGGKLSGGHDTHENDGKGKGQGVITTGFQLQHGTQVFTQVEAFSPEHREHGRGVGGGHDGGQKEAAQQRGAELSDKGAHHQGDEASGDENHEQNAQGRQGDTLLEHGPDFLETGFQAAGEQDDTHGEVPDML